jgi:serine/threonine-protein kinase RsbW
VAIPLMEKKFRRDINALSDIVEFTEHFLAGEKVGDSIGFSINLAIEELFTNMVRHNTGGGHPIAIGMKAEDGLLTVQLVDDDVDPFDPSAVPEMEVDEIIEDRRVGGLGLHLVKSIVDKITYEYENRRMKVTIVKNLGR